VAGTYKRGGGGRKRPGPPKAPAARPFWQARSKKAQSAKKPASLSLAAVGPPDEVAAAPSHQIRRLRPALFVPLAGIVFVLIMGLFGMTHLAMRHNHLGREVSRLTSQKVALTDQNRRLKADMDAMTVLEDLEAVARGRLGLISPSKGQIEIIE
jgi:hypothetical protein